LANLDQDTLDEIVAEMRRLTAGGHG